MRHNAKVHDQPKSTGKQQAPKPPIQSKETATPNLANLTQTGLQHLTPAELIRLRGMLGNRAVARLMAQRQEEDEETFEGPRKQRQEEDEETFEGPRMKPLREDAVQRGGSRVAGLSAAIGDATNVDGEGAYGWDRPMSATDVAAVVNDLVTNQASFIKDRTIYIFSGTHGTSTGNLVSTGAAGFVGEDQATANSVMSAPTTPAGTQIEVIDVPNSYPTKAALSPAFTGTNYIRILAWCYSRRSYNNSAAIKSNWWPAPDKI